MANYSRSSRLGTTMSRGELIGGLCYLPFYLVLLSWILLFLSGLLGLGWDLLTVNVVYFVCNFLAVVAIFHRFLLRSMEQVTSHFWQVVQAIILGFALYYVLNLLLGVVLSFLSPEFLNPNEQAVEGLLQDSFSLMSICTVLLAPLVEETLVRGLLFSNLYPVNRILAYGISILAFSFLHVYGYFGTVSLSDLLFSATAYIPASIALGWTYEKAGTIWGPIFLHAILNAVSTGILRYLPG